MDINNLVMFNHDVFYGSCDAYDMFMLLVSVGDMIPDIHKTRHGPHHQRWPSPQDQDVHGTG